MVILCSCSSRICEHHSRLQSCQAHAHVALLLPFSLRVTSSLEVSFAAFSVRLPRVRFARTCIISERWLGVYMVYIQRDSCLLCSTWLLTSVRFPTLQLGPFGVSDWPVRRQSPS